MADEDVTIEQLLFRDLATPIEDIVKVNQSSEAVVAQEIDEYVATENIKRDYRQILRAVAEGPSDPSEGIAIWISGFFGSGKSSFAKNLGYILRNQPLDGIPAAGLLKSKIADTETSLQIDSITARIATEVVMFDIRADASAEAKVEGLTRVIYRSLLGQLGYAEDFEVAELEIGLEAAGELNEFERVFADSYARPWSRARKESQKFSEASRVLHLIKPDTYPSADSFALTPRPPLELSPSGLVRRAYDLMSRRRPGKALAFVIDEVGQYIGYSADLIEELRAIVEQFGKEGRNRVAQGLIPGPTWIAVTSQEKLDEVVKAIDERRIDIAKLQDRFPFRVDLLPADIRVVASERVLAKNETGGERLRHLYRDHAGRINTGLALERSVRPTHVIEDDFVRFYPYPPHFVDLSIDIMSGIRLQMRGNIRHLGGSNRTIIKQSYEMLRDDRTNMRAAPIGALVTLDKIYELVESNLPSELLIDLGAIARAFPGHSWELRVARCLALLDKIRDIPRTAKNVAAMLLDSVDRVPPVAEVGRALEQLEEHGYIRTSSEGYKLQTAQEKSWTSERDGYLNPKPRDRNDLVRQALLEIFSAPALRTFSTNGRTLRVGVAIDAHGTADQGDIPLAVVVAGSPRELAARVEAARQESAATGGQNRIYWAVALDHDVDDAVSQLYASHQMVTRYDQIRANGTITATESALLADERSAQERWRQSVVNALDAVVAGGRGVFRGVEYEPHDLGNTLVERFQGLFVRAVPRLYEHMTLAAVQVKGSEVLEVLRSQNLQALPSVLYAGEGHLDLVVKQGEHFVVNKTVPVASEVLQYLDREHKFGNRVTGKDIETHFGGFGYGWEGDVLRLVVATLVRGGLVEVTHAGVKFRNASDPRVRAAFDGPRPFRAASFAPRAGELDLPTMVKAAQQYEELTGRAVDIDEASIAEAFQTFAREELNGLVGVMAVVSANHLPFSERLLAHRESLQTVDIAASDDAVRALAGEGSSFKAERDWANRVRNATTEEELTRLDLARRTLANLWPELVESEEDLVERVVQADAWLTGEDLLDHLNEVRGTAQAVEEHFTSFYDARHDKRGEVYLSALERLRSLGAYTQVAGMQEEGLAPSDTLGAITAAITAREPHPVQRRPGENHCSVCGAPPGQIAAEIEAVGAVEANARQRLEGFLAEEPAPDGVVTVRLADFFPESLDAGSIEAAVQELRQHLLDLLEQQRTIVVA